MHKESIVGRLNSRTFGLTMCVLSTIPTHGGVVLTNNFIKVLMCTTQIERISIFLKLLTFHLNLIVSYPRYSLVGLNLCDSYYSTFLKHGTFVRSAPVMAGHVLVNAQTDYTVETQHTYMYSYELLHSFSHQMLLCPLARRFSKVYTTHVVCMFDPIKQAREILTDV